MTSLLDCSSAPAQEVAAAYHERWEIEMVIDEMVIDEVDTHQRLVGQPLCSLLPLNSTADYYEI